MKSGNNYIYYKKENMSKIIKLKESDLQHIVKRVIKEDKYHTVGMTKDWEKEDWEDDLGHRLISVLEDYEHVLSNEEISDVLMSIINTMDPIENYYDKKSGRFFQ